MEDKKEFGEELFNLLVRLLNSPDNRQFFNNIRGENGVLWCLLNAEKPMSVGQLSEMMKVVPGRMADILKSLEKKGMVERKKSPLDNRVVLVSLLEPGKQKIINRRRQIQVKYNGLNDVFSDEEKAELLRLLNILLTY
ncbi:MAG: MarR family transcriptional regulator [Bacillota bacterium]|nr:MarR family transcriptional regulator [Bacillota bacterium]